MSKFIDKLLNNKFDLGNEIIAIETLLEEKFFSRGNSYIQIINKHFRSWKNRKTYISVYDLMDDVGISDLCERAESDYNITLEEYIFYCEYLLNVIEIPIDCYNASNKKYNLEQDLEICLKNYKIIKDNVNKVLDSLNFEVKFMEDLQLYKVFEKDYMVTESAEIVKSEYNLAEKIYYYNHMELKGDLFSKADILSRLYKWFEKRVVKLKNSYSDLSSNISELSNALDVRHAPNIKQEIVLKNMSKEEQEKWYDKLFKLYLSAIILYDYLEMKVDIKELKAKLNKN